MNIHHPQNPGPGGGPQYPQQGQQYPGTQPPAGYPAPPAGPVKTPVALLIAMAATALVTLSTLLSAVITLVQGEELVREYARELAGITEGSELAGLLDAALAEANSILQSHAYIWIFFGVVFAALLALGLRTGATWARIVFTVLAPIAALLGLRDMADGIADILVLFGLLIAVDSLIALVAFWLPGVGRYAKARKAA
ncbi:hypothetical protein [Acrocarpospora catenulata]|uniref:hypothetical protein n=1 Tax=Acrocarpospora catenulata TaxID=2836182 RepID=UPI001BDB4F33|nr:hypothetical protein [Acrocarpospora catenulata]